MSLYPDKPLFLSLLSQSKLFGEKGIMVIRTAVEDETLPVVDFEYLLDVLKMEQNLYTLVDKRADAMVEELEKKSTV